MAIPSGYPSEPRCTLAPTIPHQTRMHYSSRARVYPRASGKFLALCMRPCHCNTLCDYRVSPPNKRMNCRKGSSVSIVITNEPQRQRRNNNYTTVNGCQNVATAAVPETQLGQQKEDIPSASTLATRVQMKETTPNRSNWMITLCFRGQKVLRVPPASSVPPESVVFELSEQ